MRLRNLANSTRRTVSLSLVRRRGRHFVFSVVDRVVTGYADLPSRLPTQSSTLYSNNVTKFFLSMTEKVNFVVNLEDEVVRGSIVLHKGEVLPPAPMAVPPPAAPSPAATKAAEEEVTKALTPWKRATREVATVTAGMGSIVALGKFTGPALMSNFFTFGLASLIGYRVVWGVSPAVSFFSRSSRPWMETLTSFILSSTLRLCPSRMRSLVWSVSVDCLSWAEDTSLEQFLKPLVHSRSCWPVSTSLEDSLLPRGCWICSNVGLFHLLSRLSGLFTGEMCRPH